MAKTKALAVAKPVTGEVVETRSFAAIIGHAKPLWDKMTSAFQTFGQTAMQLGMALLPDYTDYRQAYEDNTGKLRGARESWIASLEHGKYMKDGKPSSGAIKRWEFIESEGRAGKALEIARQLKADPDALAALKDTKRKELVADLGRHVNALEKDDAKFVETLTAGIGKKAQSKAVSLTIQRNRAVQTLIEMTSLSERDTIKALIESDFRLNEEQAKTFWSRSMKDAQAIKGLDVVQHARIKAHKAKAAKAAKAA